MKRITICLFGALILAFGVACGDDDKKDGGTDTTQPDTTQSDTTQSDTTQSDTTQSDTTQTDTTVAMDTTDAGGPLVLTVDNTFADDDPDPTHFRTIAAALAVANAESGDAEVRVLVKPGTGTYAEELPLRLTRANVTLEAQSSPDFDDNLTYGQPITLRADGSSTIPEDLGMIAISADDVSVCGFTIDATGATIAVTVHGLTPDNGEPVDDNLSAVTPVSGFEICHNTIQDSQFVGIVTEAASGEIHHNRIARGRIGAVLTGGPGAFAAGTSTHIDFVSNFLEHNTAIGGCFIGNLDVPFASILSAEIPNTARGPSSLSVTSDDNIYSQNGTAIQLVFYGVYPNIADASELVVEADDNVFQNNGIAFTSVSLQCGRGETNCDIDAASTIDLTIGDGNSYEGGTCRAAFGTELFRSEGWYGEDYDVTVSDPGGFLFDANDTPLFSWSTGPAELGNDITVNGASYAGNIAPPACRPEGVSIFTSYRGEDLVLLQAEMDRLTGSQLSVVFENYEEEDILQAVAAGYPPDIALIPQPGVYAGLARDGHLVDLTPHLDMTQLAKDYAPYLIDLATVDGELHGGFIDINVKSLVWYAPSAFAAKSYEIPTTWEALLALSDEIVADGGTPWCLPMESGPATGWVGTDWIEDIVLRQAGPTVYDAWAKGELPFSDDAIKAAFETFGEILDTPGYVHRRDEVTSDPFWTGIGPLFNDPPDCYLHRQASFAAFFFPPDQNLTPGVDGTTFPLPSMNEGAAPPMLGGGTMFAVFNDDADTLAVAKHLLSPAWGEGTAEDGAGFIRPNLRFDRTKYAQELTKTFADLAAAALAEDAFRFDASDLMPQEVGAGSFWTGIVDFVEGDNLTTILKTIDDSWPE